GERALTCRAPLVLSLRRAPRRRGMTSRGPTWLARSSFEPMTAPGGVARGLRVSPRRAGRDAHHALERAIEGRLRLVTETGSHVHEDRIVVPELRLRRIHS